MPKPSLEKNWNYTIQPIAKEIRGLIPFPNGISLEVSLIAWLEFELAYFEAAVQHFSHYAIVTPPFYSLLGFFLLLWKWGLQGLYLLFQRVYLSVHYRQPNVKLPDFVSIFIEPLGKAEALTEWRKKKENEEKIMPLISII